ncbi:MAG: acid phosphatase type 7, partial [Gaiellales bacterium]|nr:acid phosphatase type 7 [Gaiellales bacterium]
NFATDRSGSAASVAYGSASDGSCSLTSTQTAARTTVTVGSVSEYQWKASLSLPISGQYCYRPTLGMTDLLGTGASPVFTTQAPAGSSAPFSFAVFGDWGLVNAGGNADQQNLLAQIAASGVRFAVTTGDNGYPSGSQTNYGDLQQVGDGVSAIFGADFWPVPGATIPLFTAAGNHGLSGTTHADLTNWPQDQAVSSSDGRYQNDVYCCVNGTSSANYSSSWYAFDAGPARFYVLTSAWGDTNTGNAGVYANDAAAHWSPGTPEYEWLLADLKAHPGGLKFAFSHYPFHSDDKSQGSDTFIDGADGLEGMLATYGVDIAFNGHSHVYERNRPAAKGYPVTYVTGGGGGVLEPIGPCSSIDAYGIGWSPSSLAGSACGDASVPTSASRVFHFLKVTVSGTSVTVAPTDSLGRTFDVETYSFADATTPDTVIDSAPAPISNTRSGRATFHSTVTGATFSCAIDGGVPAPCMSPQTFSGLADGSHTFTVAASVGSATDASPASATWSVDATSPSAPAATATALSSSSIKLDWTASTDAGGLAGYDIYRDGAATPTATVGPAVTTFTDTALAPSTLYSYVVRAKDSAGNTTDSPAASATTLDDSPDTVIDSGGSGISNTSSMMISFHATGTVTGSPTFLCTIDGGAPATCTSPTLYTTLVDGTHVFTVAAKDDSGTDATPATTSWRSDTTEPTVPASPVATPLSSIPTEANARPTLRTRPRIAGLPRAGRMLICAHGNWNGTPVRYAFTWRRGRRIAGHRSAYRVGRADRGHSLSCEVTAANANGATRAATKAVHVPLPRTRRPAAHPARST